MENQPHNHPVRTKLFVPGHWDWRVNCPGHGCGTSKDPRPHPVQRPDWLQPPVMGWMMVTEAGNEDLDSFSYEHEPECLDRLGGAIGPRGVHGYAYAKRADLPCYGGSGAVTALTGVLDDDKKLTALPGLRRYPSAVELLAYPHGAVDVRAVVRRIAEGLGLKHAFHRLYEQVPMLADHVPCDNVHAERFTPAGMYKNAVGSTNTWADDYVVPLPWCDRMGLRFWRAKPTHEQISWYIHLSVLGATWSYKEVGDFESRVWVHVVAQSRFTFLTGLHNWPELVRYRTLAEQIGMAALNAVYGVSPSCAAQALRLTKVDCPPE